MDIVDHIFSSLGADDIVSTVNANEQRSNEDPNDHQIKSEDVYYGPTIRVSSGMTAITNMTGSATSTDKIYLVGVPINIGLYMSALENDDPENFRLNLGIEFSQIMGSSTDNYLNNISLNIITTIMNYGSVAGLGLKFGLFGEWGHFSEDSADESSNYEADIWDSGLSISIPVIEFKIGDFSTFFIEWAGRIGLGQKNEEFEVFYDEFVGFGFQLIPDELNEQ